MNSDPLHQLYTHYSELPWSQRVLYTCTLLVLGLAYLFAVIYLFHSYAGRDGDPTTLSYEDVVIAYTGTGKGSRLEAALRGPMATMLPAEEAANIIGWVAETPPRTSTMAGSRPSSTSAASVATMVATRTCPI